jgi:hypothetical protein
MSTLIARAGNKTIASVMLSERKAARNAAEFCFRMSGFLLKSRSGSWRGKIERTILA